MGNEHWDFDDVVDFLLDKISHQIHNYLTQHLHVHLQIQHMEEQDAHQSTDYQ